MGIPLWKAVEVTLIWLVAVLFAVPEALAFDMLEVPYRGKKLRVCLLHPVQTTNFMKVIHLPKWSVPYSVQAIYLNVFMNGQIPFYATFRQQCEVTDQIDLRCTLFDRFCHVARNVQRCRLASVNRSRRVRCEAEHQAGDSRSFCNGASNSEAARRAAQHEL